MRSTDRDSLGSMKVAVKLRNRRAPRLTLARPLRPRRRRGLKTISVQLPLLVVGLLPSLSVAQPASLPSLWAHGVPQAPRGAAGAAGSNAYLGMVGRTTARSERRLHRRVPLTCPAGTKRRIRTLRRQRSNRIAGAEQPSREIYCRRPDGTKHGPITQLRGFTRVRTSSLMTRSSLPGRNVMRFGNFNEGKRDGTWIQLDRSGRELGRMTLSDGTGTWRVWHRSGGLAVNGKMEGDQREGTWRSFFAAGGTAMVGRYKAEQRQGTWRWFYNSGEPFRTVEFKGGQRHGLYTDWWVSGTKQKEGNYRRGLRDGPWLRWNREGHLLGVHHLHEGSGEWAEWYRSGDLREAGSVVNDKRHGLWRGWHETGALMQQGQYRKHVRVPGTWRYFDQSGHPKVKSRNRRAERRGGIISRLSRAGGSVAGITGRLRPTVTIGKGSLVRKLGVRRRNKKGVAQFNVTQGSGPRVNPKVQVGAVKGVNIAWFSKTQGVKLQQRQAQILRVLVTACAQRFHIQQANRGVRPRGGGKAVVSTALRWMLDVQADGTVSRTIRTNSPRQLISRGGFKCADAVVARALFVPRKGRPPYTVRLVATLKH